MKKILLLALWGVSVAATAQEPVTYFLPATTVGLEVEAVRETSFAGPYAAFAKKYLGIDVRLKDETRTYLVSVGLEPATEADPAARFSVDPGKEADRFLALSAQGLISLGEDTPPEAVRWNFVAPERSDFNRKGVSAGQAKERRTTYKNVKSDSTDIFTQVPVYQDVVVTRTPEQRAREAAELILKVRQERYKITVGDTDATYSGEALGSAIAELTRMEEEYMTLFVGYTVKETQHASFEVRPEPGRDQAYPVFRISPEDGVIAPDDGEGTLYYLSFAPEKTAEARPVPEEAAGGKHAKEKKESKTARYIHYRIPAVCTVSLGSGTERLIRTRMPVWQLGEDVRYQIHK